MVAVLAARLAALIVFFGMLQRSATADSSAEIKPLLYGATDARGKVLRPEAFTLTQRGARWTSEGAEMVFTSLNDGFGCYRFDAASARFSQAFLHSELRVPLTLNRDYIVGAVVRCDFARESAEINLRLGQQSSDGERRPGLRELGLPAKTSGPGGWQRVEWEISTRPDGLGTHATCEVRAFFRDVKMAGEIKFEIADFVFIELPPKPLKLYARGEGARFRGGPGDLPMRVESASATGHVITVKTTGAEYRFDSVANTIEATQVLEERRLSARWRLTCELQNLRIESTTSKECVLANDQITFGVQADTLLLMVPRVEVSIELENFIGGPWNRCEIGSLLSQDDLGGLTVNPDVPTGTGRVARMRPITPNLDFLSWTVANTGSLSTAAPGWKMAWDISPGERLGTSLMPCRPYDWAASFDTFWHLAYASNDPQTYGDRKPAVTDWLLWDFQVRTWGMSDSTEYAVRDEKLLRAHIDGIHAAGDRALPYTSAFFHRSREPADYVNAVRNLRDRFGLDGVYSDGLPGVEWLVAYEEMRMLRELFPKGSIIIHDTFEQTGRVAPFAFIHTYADRTFLAEGTPYGNDRAWPYPRQEVAQFRRANCIGDIQGEAWKGIGNTPAVDLLNLVYNGRVIAQRDWFETETLPAVRKLKAVWKEHGTDPLFYDRYYLPAAHQITGMRVGRTGMPIVDVDAAEPSGKRVILRCQSAGADIRYTTDGSVPTAASPRYENPIPIRKPFRLQAIAYAQGLEPSRAASAIVEP